METNEKRKRNDEFWWNSGKIRWISMRFRWIERQSWDESGASREIWMNFREFRWIQRGVRYGGLGEFIEDIDEL